MAGFRQRKTHDFHYTLTKTICCNMHGDTPSTTKSRRSTPQSTSSHEVLPLYALQGASPQPSGCHKRRRQSLSSSSDASTFSTLAPTIEDLPDATLARILGSSKVNHGTGCAAQNVYQECQAGLLAINLHVLPPLER